MPNKAGWTATTPFPSRTTTTQNSTAFGLRVLNEDRIAPAKGFVPHPHRDMEIITTVLEVLGTPDLAMGAFFGPGEVQYVLAGSGIRHSELNHSAIEPLRLLQIWLLPNKNGVHCITRRSFIP